MSFHIKLRFLKRSNLISPSCTESQRGLVGWILFLSLFILGVTNFKLNKVFVGFIKVLTKDQWPSRKKVRTKSHRRKSSWLKKKKLQEKKGKISCLGDRVFFFVWQRTRKFGHCHSFFFFHVVVAFLTRFKTFLVLTGSLRQGFVRLKLTFLK